MVNGEIATRRELLRDVDQEEEGSTSSELKAIEQHTIHTQLAVVVGVDVYARGFRSLRKARDDAEAVAEILKNDYGFDLIPEGTPILDEAATLQAVQQAVQDSLNNATASTRWLFYFAGHGLVDNEGYLVPSSASPDDRTTYLPLLWLREHCLKSRAAEVLVILDSCYSGQALVSDVRLDSILKDSIPPEEAGGHRDRVRQILTSGNPDQVVLDGGGSKHSIFTEALLEALGGLAGIHEHDGTVRFPALWEFLRCDVPTRASDPEWRQQPIGGNLMGNKWGLNFALISKAPRLAPDTVRSARSTDPVKRRHALEALAGERDRKETLMLAVDLAIGHLRGELPIRPHQPPPADCPDVPFNPPDDALEARVRAEAAATLGKLGNPKAVGPLTEALGDEPEVCRAAAQALAGLADPTAAPHLLRRLRASGEELLLDLVGAIGAVGDDEVTVDALGECLRREALVPFIGPDLPEHLTGLLDRATIARQLVQHRPLSSRPDISLEEAARATMLSDSRRGFEEPLRREFDHRAVEPGPLYQALSRLNAPLWLSCAYDNLLADSLNADTIVTAGHVHYARPGRRAVVRLTREAVGDYNTELRLLVLDSDYAQFRKSETDRKELINYLESNLRGKVVLFIGADPSSHDFELLVEHILNRHLANVDVRAFLVWEAQGPPLRWGRRPIKQLRRQILPLIEDLASEQPPALAPRVPGRDGEQEPRAKGG